MKDHLKDLKSSVHEGSLERLEIINLKYPLSSVNHGTCQGLGRLISFTRKKTHISTIIEIIKNYES